MSNCKDNTLKVSPSLIYDEQIEFTDVGGENVNLNFEKLKQHSPILIFIPNTNELQRFILSHAFDELNKNHLLHYIIPSGEADMMRATAPDTFNSHNTHELYVPPERFTKWSTLFQAACYHYSNRSPSFAIRANLSLKSSKSSKVIVKAIKKTVFNIINCLLSITWPKYIASRLNKWYKKFQSSVIYPQQFAYTSHKKYQAFVDSTMQSMGPLQEIIELINRFNPLYCLIPTSLLDLFCNDVIWACEVEQVACVLLQSGWDNLSSKGILHQRTPFLGCWGPQSASHARGIQKINRHRIANIGAPHYEYLKPASSKEITEIRQALGVSSDQSLILFGGSFRQFDETSLLKKLDSAIDKGQLGALKVLYRPHPWRASREYEDNFFMHEWKHILFDIPMRERYLQEQNNKGYIKRNLPMFSMSYLAKILSAVDAVISPMSTLLIESLIMGKPTMAVAFGDGKHQHNPSVTAQMTHFKELRHSKALIWCNVKHQFISDCVDLLGKNRENLYKTKTEQINLLAQIVTCSDESYAERLYNFCRYMVEPEARKLRGLRTARKRGTISHAYGANKIANEYCQGKLLNPIIPGYWMHGWIPAFHNIDPALIALHKKEGQSAGYDYSKQILEEKENVAQWVARPDQAEYLISHGYKKVKAIGLPIIYLPHSPVRRIKGSLLVMPPHSHKNHGPHDPLANQYANVIAELKPHFQHILVGLNEDDIAKNQWVESFQRHGIQVFPTSDQADFNTLARLKDILSTFEYVTTNGYGSHIALAAYCGAKVSIFGPYADFPLERMRNTHAVKMFPALLQNAYYLCTESALKKHYPFLFVEPHKALSLTAWGASEVGESCRLDPHELASTFEWD